MLAHQDDAVSDDLRQCLARQFDNAWGLLALHLDGLDDKTILWRPAAVGMHVYESDDGLWRAEWPEHEDYTVGPPSIAWLTWHIGFWLTMVLDHTFEGGTCTRESVVWPGSALLTRRWLDDLRQQWVVARDGLDGTQMADRLLAKWPFRARPFSDVVAWVNAELMKNAAEIGFVRFLYAARAG